MVPKINNRGHNFMGITLYLMHDKESNEAERVGWYEIGNLHTKDPLKAAKIMAWTAINAELLKELSAGRKAETGAVYHYSLSWAPDEQPSEAHQRDTALNSIAHLELAEHQRLMFSHNDTKHVNVHIVVNLTHPETGKRASPSFDKRALQDWALNYEREHGVYCHQREENAKQREQGTSNKDRITARK